MSHKVLGLEVNTKAFSARLPLLNWLNANFKCEIVESEVIDGT